MLATLIYKMLVITFAIIVLIGGSRGSFIRLNTTNGGVTSLSKGTYTLNVNNENVTSFSLGASLYRYEIVKKGNVVIFALYNVSKLNIDIEKVSSEAIAEGSGGYMISLILTINNTCPKNAYGWIGSPKGYPLLPIFEGFSERCGLRLSTAGFPLTSKRWATFVFSWKNSSMIIVFGPLSITSKPVTSSSSHTRSIFTTMTLVHEKRGNNTLKSFISNSGTWVTSLIALALGLVALIVSLVYEIGGLRER